MKSIRAPERIRSLSRRLFIDHGMGLVIGAGAKVLLRQEQAIAFNDKADLDHGRLPDTITETLTALVAHVESLEKRVNGGGVYGPALHPPEKGVWHWGDFSI